MKKLLGELFDGKSAASSSVIIEPTRDSFYIYSSLEYKLLHQVDYDLCKIEILKDHKTIISYEEIECHLKWNEWVEFRTSPFFQEKLESKVDNKNLVLFYLVGLVLCIGIIYKTLPIFSNVIAGFIPIETESKIFASMSSGIKKKSCKNISSKTEVLKILKLLGEDSVEVIVTNQEVVNAFALPGNTIVIPIGFLKYIETPEELAGVLAHELGHVKHRHHVRLLFKQFFFSLLFNAFFGFTSVDGAEYLKLILLQSYSKEEEYEADQYAINRLKERRISAIGVADFFRRLDKESSAIVKYLNFSHPENMERVAKFTKSKIKNPITIVKNIKKWKKKLISCH